MLVVLMHYLFVLPQIFVYLGKGINTNRISSVIKQKQVVIGGDDVHFVLEQYPCLSEMPTGSNNNTLTITKEELLIQTYVQYNTYIHVYEIVRKKNLLRRKHNVIFSLMC